MKRIILASKNAHKAKEIQAILGDSFEVLPQTEVGVDIDVVEDGSTFEENAIKKAASIMKVAGEITIADDSGLVVDALNGAPGTYTARFAGEGATDEQNIQKLLLELDGLPFYKRTARFVCVIAVAYPNGETKTVRGETEGYILTEKQGENGFGYDPVFYNEAYDCSFAQLEPSIKNKISHRAVALKKIKKTIVKNNYL